MSVITQDGYSALIVAAINGHTEVVVELVKARANMDLQNEVYSKLHVHVLYVLSPFFMLVHVYTY